MMFRLHGCRYFVLILLLAVMSGCVKEKCFENFHCTSPQVCGPEGVCVFECVLPGDCLSGFECVGNVCRPARPNDVFEAVAPVLYCPAGMALVEKSFCIDIFEASRPDSTSASPGVDGSRAVTRKGAHPWMTTDNQVASAACAASGKRLCLPAEWGLACSGPDGTVYSYGDSYEPTTCNGIDTYGRSSFHLMPTGSFPACVNEYGVFDMNGNVWEHVAGGDGTDVRGGAYNCSDSSKLHKCSYIPGNWIPSALGFRCCQDPLEIDPDDVERVEAADAVVVADGWHTDAVIDSDLAIPDSSDKDICTGPDSVIPDNVFADEGLIDVVEPVDVVLPDLVSHDSGDAVLDVISDQGYLDAPIDAALDSGQDVSAWSCPDDMVLVLHPSRSPFCMDRYEAARFDSTSSTAGTSSVPVSQPGRIPWASSAVNLSVAKAACASADKRICRQDEWVDACSGSSGKVYSYGNSYDPAVCNSIDTFCYCDTTCAAVQECPYPHCRVQASPAGDGGPCGAAFHVVATGSFQGCVNEWGAYDINGNVWEVTDAGDGIDHFRGGAYNCSDSEALHRCDHDGNWGPSARGFRCCRDAAPTGGGGRI